MLGAIVRIGPDGHQATLGCWVVRSSRGRGIGTRALRAVAEWTFETTDVVRVDAYIMVGNEVSERMTQRAGFQREGVKRNALIVDGAAVNEICMARIFC